MRCVITFLCLAIFSLTAAAQQEDFVPIAYANGLLGGVVKGKWLSGQEVAPLLKEKTEFVIVGLKGVEKTGAIFGSKGEEFGACPDVTSINFEPKNESSLAVGANAKWNLVPRIAKFNALTDKTSVKIAAAFLKTKSIVKAKVKLTQAFSVDLDGDGQNERIIVGNYYKRGMMEEPGAGDYSFVLLRKTVKGKPQNILLEGDFFTRKGEYAPPNEREISAVADLDGDGNMEIVLHGYYYEGDWSIVFQLKENKAIKVLEVDCGL